MREVVITDLQDWRVDTRSAVAVGTSAFLTTDVPLRLSRGPAGLLAQAPAVDVLTTLEVSGDCVLCKSFAYTPGARPEGLMIVWPGTLHTQSIVGAQLIAS